jgi:hypothetical protein
VIAHPPCRCWCRAWPLSSMSVAARIQEMLLAFECLRQVRRHGGILEQPAHSRFWNAASLPMPSAPPTPGHEWSIAVDQLNWGHRASKPTWLLLCGITPEQVTFTGWGLHIPSAATVTSLTPSQRSATPKAFAAWLIENAARGRPGRP